MSPLVTEDDVLAVSEQMRSFWIGRGEEVAELERVIADWVGAKYAVALGSGTAALTVAMSSLPHLYVDYPTVCDALDLAAKAAGKRKGFDGMRVSIYPDEGGHIVDYARHLPAKHQSKLLARFGVFSFGALKDVSGGIGGAVVSNYPIEAGDWRKLSPISDINAAMILSQLSRYKHKQERLVANGQRWSLCV